MQSKIKERLKSKYSGVNLSNKRLDAIANKIASKITTEDEIDAKLDDLNDLMPFADIAKDDDRLRTLETQAKGANKNQSTSANSDDDDDKDDVINKPDAKKPSKWDKAMDAIEKLTQTVSTLKAEKQGETIKQKIAASEKLKGIPEILWKKRILPTDEKDIEAFIDDVAGDFTAFETESGYSRVNTKAPAAGKPDAQRVAKADADIVNFAKAKNESAKAAMQKKTA